MGRPNVIDEIVNAFARRGADRYGKEDVTQQEHALQCAQLAAKSGASAQMIAAALLHDIGHILHDDALPVDCSANLDDHHETRGFAFLRQHFVPELVDPIRLHVAAKRYLCTVEPDYAQQLSPTSLKSYHDQGGPMSDEELRAFELEPHFREALMLRRWDDAGKDSSVSTPTVADFKKHLEACLQ